MKLMAAALVIMGCGALQVLGTTLPLVEEGASDYQIVMAESGDSGKIEEAAGLLRDLLRQSTGVDLPVYWESEVEEGKPGIYLGQTRATREAGIDVDSVKGWSYVIRTKGPDLFLVGEDTDGDGRERFIGRSGTYKAVTAFLEKVVGVRFVLPGPDGVHVPEMDRIEVEEKLTMEWSPLFDMVIGRRVRTHGPASGRAGYPQDRIYDPYAIANNFYGETGNDLFKSYGSHSYPDMVPASKYFESNPEYFRMNNDGVRDPTSRGHLCISNPEVHDLLLEQIGRDYEEGYQMVMLGQSDGYAECQCDECQAIHPDRGEKLWIVNTELAGRLKEQYPDRQVVLLSYVWTTKPPVTFSEFPDNVVILNNRYIPEYFEVWRERVTPRIVFNANWLGRQRRIPPRYAVDQIRLFLENEVIGIYLCGGLDCGSGSGWGLNGPGYYAFGQAMNDPVRDADELEWEFIEAAYGEAAPPMRQFFELMHRRWEVRSRFDRLEVGLPDRAYRGYPFSMKSSDDYAHYFAPEILIQMNAALERAKSVAEDEKVKARLKLVEGEFRHVQAVASVHHMFRAYRLLPSWDTFNALETMVEKYRQVMEWLLPEGRPWGSGGIRAPFNQQISEINTEPFNWDFDKIRAEGELPEARLEIQVRGGERLPPYEIPEESRHRFRGGGMNDGLEDFSEDHAFPEGPEAPYDM